LHRYAWAIKKAREELTTLNGRDVTVGLALFTTIILQRKHPRNFDDKPVWSM
jgi:hypothetical protein